MLIHVVKPGETLWQISVYYGVPIAKTMDANKLPNPGQLVIGQSIVIPIEGVYHTVSPGESLWSIAQTYKTNVAGIIRVNQITNPAAIYPGLRLYIPAPLYQVKPGETLSQIAKRYGVTVDDLMKVNNISDPSMVYPGQILIIPIKERPVVNVNAYIDRYGQEAVPPVMEAGKYLTYLSPFAYKIKEDGSLETIDDVPAISAAYSKNAVPMMAITNFTSTELGENVAHIVLSSKEISEQLITNIIKVLKEKNYKGVNIDFENVLPQDRELYNQFLKRTVDSLHKEGYFVSTALAPKTSAEQKGSLYEAHDYEAHGRIVDFVILMTYEWGYRLGPPQAISPLNEIKKVLDYAVSVIPKEKIYFGFQLYARDWVLPHVQGEEAETFSMQQAIIRAVKYGAVIEYDPVAQSPFYQYRDEKGIMHEVWFEDARSAEAKFDTVKAYKLNGISYWVLGYPFPQNWILLEDDFTIKKLL
ncbi:Spore germination protein YaaH [Clostridium liquoris]|jgi:spore germination protein|uniref:Spore germination protein YaaH n=1 Tax=Clostridium liquoris TaxID=1289519 RepID=A0A2T0B408_9CLOT|nr:LysM peptidoglycan-binding domain-containing protein [Clostridium liquoris]PRR78628.1 Spore germination protein YaaH [Clostridium liquoris]